MLCASGLLYIEHACVRCAVIAARGRAADVSVQRRPLPKQLLPEGAVRQQLFVYLDLTCNYVRDRLHRVERERDIFGSARQGQSSEACSLSLLITVVSCRRAIPSRRLRQGRQDLVREAIPSVGVRRCESLTLFAPIK